MIKLVIGSMVLCHLIVSSPDGKEDSILKLVGEVQEFQDAHKYVEDLEKREAYKVHRKTLIVKGISHEGLFLIEPTACMIVKTEDDLQKEMERPIEVNPTPVVELEKEEKKPLREQIKEIIQPKKDEEKKPVVKKPKVKKKVAPKLVAPTTPVKVEKAPVIDKKEEMPPQAIPVPESKPQDKDEVSSVELKPDPKKSVEEEKPFEKEEKPKKKGILDYLK